jgi:hypothetical protein
VVGPWRGGGWGTVGFLEDGVQELVSGDATSARVVEQIRELVRDDEAHAAVRREGDRTSSIDLFETHHNPRLPNVPRSVNQMSTICPAGIASRELCLPPTHLRR